MEPKSLIADKKKAIIDELFDQVVAAYPEDGARFFKQKSDPFDNPVGSTITRCLNELFDELTKPEMDMKAVRHALDGIVRIQSVQEFQPSDAIGFIFSLKPILSDKLKKHRGDKSVEKYLSELDDTVEQFLRIAFDLYMDCRQQVFRFRANQAKDRVRQLLIKKGYIHELPEKGKNLEDIEE